MGKVRKKILMAFCILLAAAGLMTLHPVTASAASYKSLYKKFLSKSEVSAGDSTITPNYYYVLNINRSGVPELIVSDGGSAVVQYYVYTIKNGKVKYLGSYAAKGTGTTLYYSKKYKAMAACGWTNGIGGDWCNLYRISKSKVVSYRHIMSEYNSSGKQIYFYGKSSTNRKQVSKTKYNSYVKKYTKSLKKISMKKNTASNRKKSFG